MGYLQIHNISKAYKRYPKKWGRMAEWLGMGKHHDLRWVLRDISFDVAPGESIGIIGVNGAGKSTLLKIITGITRPSSGSVRIAGRISALLELGIGFHSEFTGRQNAYMGAQLQGFSLSEVVDKINQIEEFAEIGDYFDQPVRTYSSGMQVRLAFSVATCTRPEILIVDEALSVGDTYFKHKSFDRIRKFRDQGTTLLFVSHDPGAIKTLCNRAILIDEGYVQRDDMPDAVLDYYNAVIAKRDVAYDIRQPMDSTGKKATRSGGEEVSIISVELHHEGQPVRTIRSGSPAVIRVVSQSHRPVDELTVGILIRDRLGNDIFGTNSFHHGVSRYHMDVDEISTIEFEFQSLGLGQGSYTLTSALHSRDSHVTANFDWWDRALVFQVLPDDSPLSIGVSRIPVTVKWIE